VGTGVAKVRARIIFGGGPSGSQFRGSRFRRPGHLTVSPSEFRDVDSLRLRSHSTVRMFTAGIQDGPPEFCGC